MMDEYIPSPRLTPNKPRRMRDTSSVYAVDERKLLLEAILKRQRESSSGDATRARGRSSDCASGELSPRCRFVRREDRGCPVYRWASKSSASSGSEYDGDESDDTSVGEENKLRADCGTETSHSGGDEDDDNNEEDNSDDFEDIVGNGGSEIGNAFDRDAEDDDDDVNKEGKKPDRRRSHFYQDSEGLKQDAGSSFRLTKIANRRDVLLGRDELTSPGKLLYGRHYLWYQSAGFVRPQGGI